MGSIRRQVNLIHYNIWRFERWWRYLVFGERRLTTISDRDDDRELRDYVPLAVGPVDESMLPNYTGKHFGTLVFIVLLSIWNVVCGIFGVHISGRWYWGAIMAGIVAFVADLYLMPERHILLAEFKIFESLPASKKRISGFLTLFIVTGTWAVFFFSFWFYLGVMIAAK